MYVLSCSDHNFLFFHSIGLCMCEFVISISFISINHCLFFSRRAGGCKAKSRVISGIQAKWIGQTTIAWYELIILSFIYLLIREHITWYIKVLCISIYYIVYECIRFTLCIPSCHKSIQNTERFNPDIPFRIITIIMISNESKNQCDYIHHISIIDNTQTIH